MLEIEYVIVENFKKKYDATGLCLPGVLAGFPPEKMNPASN